MAASLTDNHITFLAATDWRGQQARFGIKQADRFSHLYLIGKTGMGKSTLLENLIAADLAAGAGLCLLDPHGDLVGRVKQLIPPARQADIIDFDPAGPQPLGLNVLEQPSDKYRHLIASGLISVCKKLWADSWGPRLEHILRQAVLTLLELPSATLADLPRLLVDETFRRSVIKQVTDDQLKDFWAKEFDQYSKNFRTEAIAPIQNKIGQFLAHRLIRQIVAQPKSSFSLRQAMDEGQILLVNLAKGKLGEDASSLLGALLLTRLELAALSRAAQPPEQRRPFFVYIDEFHSFATASFATVLSELRKYKISLTLTHQYLEQLDEELQAAIFGNVGTIIAFRLGARDAEIFAKEFFPAFTEEDLLNLPKYRIAIKLMIDGAPSQPFSAQTFPPLESNDR